MNLIAYEENLRNKRYIRRVGRNGLEVRANKITYRGLPWYALSSYNKRKCENLLLLNFADHLKPTYV